MIFFWIAGRSGDMSRRSMFVIIAALWGALLRSIRIIRMSIVHRRNNSSTGSTQDYTPAKLECRIAIQKETARIVCPLQGRCFDRPTIKITSPGRRAGTPHTITVIPFRQRIFSRHESTTNQAERDWIMDTKQTQRFACSRSGLTNVSRLGRSRLSWRCVHL